MKRNTPVSKLMTRQLTTVHTAMKPSEARRALSSEPFQHLPVVSGDKLVGILSSADLTRVELNGWGTDRRSLDAILDHQFTIEELMTTEVETLNPTAKVKDAALLMGEGRFHAVPIVDGEGRLEGMITTTDLVRYLADLV